MPGAPARRPATGVKDSMPTGTSPKPSQMTLEEERRHFLSVMGKTLDEWAQVETHLCSLFIVCLGAPPDHARASFYAVENFSSKLPMIDSLLALTISDHKTLGEWMLLYERVKSSFKLRSELVHYDILENRNQKPGVRVTLRPSILDPRAPSLFLKFGLRLGEIKIRQGVFRELWGDLSIFYADLCKKRSLPRGSLQ